MINPLNISDLGRKEPVNPIKPVLPIERTLPANPPHEFSAAPYHMIKKLRGGTINTMV